MLPENRQGRLPKAYLKATCSKAIGMYARVGHANETVPLDGVHNINIEITCGLTAKLAMRSWITWALWQKLKSKYQSPTDPRTMSTSSA